MRIRTHPSCNLARMHSFTRPVLGDRAWLAKIHLVGDTFDQRLRTGDDRRNLKRPLQKLLEKQGTHKTRTVVLHIEVVQSRSGGTNDRISTAAGTFPQLGVAGQPPTSPR